METYVFPVPLNKAAEFECGYTRVVVPHRHGYYVTGIVSKIDFGTTTALVEVIVDAREL